LRQVPRPDRLHQDVAIAMLDQTVLSVFNFLLQMGLVRFWSPDRYGVFALFANALLTLANVQNGMFTTQYGVLVPQAQDGEKQLLRAALFSWNVVFCAASAAVVALLIHYVAADQSGATLIAGMLYFAMGLMREYTRVIMMSEGRVATALWTDLAGLLVSIATILAWLHVYGTIDIWHILLSLAMGSATSVIIEVIANRHLYPLSLARRVRLRYVDVFRRHVTWALAGIATTEIQLRTLFFLLGAWYGLAAVGVVQAGLMLFRPIGVLWFAWSRVMRPAFARAYADGKDAQAARLAHLSAIAFLLGTLALLAVLYLAWPLIDRYIYAYRYPGVGQATAFWGLVMILSFVRGTYSVRMQGQARFRELSHVSLVAALVTVALVVTIAHFRGPIDTILANVAGEMFMLGAVMWIMDRKTGDGAR
jgi:O-antigen/teichoic acid export membrane protein